MDLVSSSTPTLTEFNPTIIPFQLRTIEHVRLHHDYSTGPAEVLLSGSVGSAKSILAAHLVVTHALFYPGSQILIVRRSLKDLKATFWRVLLAHFPRMSDSLNKSEMKISLPNGSIIYGSSYDDGRYDKFRSYELSMAVIEEAVEAKDCSVYDEIRMRIGRLPHVRESLILLVTNPSSPSSWIYQRFIDKPTSGTKVFYSKTTDNPFLPDWYIKSLRETLDPKLARRMLEGEWVELSKDQVYYNYEKERNFKSDFKSRGKTLKLTHDFNIGKNKPMSAAACEEIDGVYHFFKAFHVDGARTENIMEEIASSGILDQYLKIEVYGDASGRNKDTRSIKTDYDIIEHFLANYVTRDGRRLNFEIKVPRSNPPIRRRHNIVNAYFLNNEKKIRLFVYDKWLDEGFRLTTFLKGSFLSEDDSLPQQHATTTIGYMIDYDVNREDSHSYQIQL